MITVVILNAMKNPIKILRFTQNDEGLRMTSGKGLDLSFSCDEECPGEWPFNNLHL